jgi:hypothetical protein
MSPAEMTWRARDQALRATWWRRRVRREEIPAILPRSGGSRSFTALLPPSAADRVTDSAEAALRTAAHQAYLKLADDLEGFLARLRAGSAAVATEDRQRVLGAVVQDILIGPEKLTIRHRITVREHAASNGGHHDTTDTEGDMREGSLLRCGRECP